MAVAGGSTREETQLNYGAEACMVATFLSDEMQSLPKGYYVYDKKRDEHHTYYPVNPLDLPTLMRLDKGPFRFGVTACGIKVHLLPLKEKPQFCKSTFTCRLVHLDCYFLHNCICLQFLTALYVVVVC
jgi:hypothetical protein